MKKYRRLAKVRRELENVLILVDELAARGIPKCIIIEILKDERQKTDREDEHSGQDE